MAKTPEERAAYLKAWNKRNPERRAQHRKNMLVYVRARVDRWDEYRKTLKCERCGFDDFRALEHHHRDPAEKQFSIGYAVRRMNWERVMAEIEKCEVICANCHRIEHYRNLPQTPDDRRITPVAEAA